VDGETIDHDIVIRLSGRIRKRNKKLSKQPYGTSHTVSRAEAEPIYDDAEQVIVAFTALVAMNVGRYFDNRSASPPSYRSS
jgi:hypothetical protein